MTMRLSTILLAALLLFPAGNLRADETDPHGKGHGFPADYEEIETSPTVAEGITKYAPDDDDGAHSNFGVTPVHDDELFSILRVDRLEYQTKEGNPLLLWDVTGRFGDDYNKLYLESEAEWLIDEEKFEGAELEVFYGRTISSFWDFKIGLRHDFNPLPQRTFGAIGVEGLAPYWFEVEATAYLSEDADLYAKIELEYELLLTQRLILQPRLEVEFAAQDVPEYGTARGLTDYEAGLRLRYEICREFAPYVGFSWSQKVGENGRLVEAEGEDAEKASFVAGIRMWF